MQNKLDLNYQNLLKDILENGIKKEILVVSLNFQVVEFNEHYCLLQYDYDKERILKIYSFENDYKTVKKYYEQSR